MFVLVRNTLTFVITTTIAVAGVAVGSLIVCLNIPVVLGAVLTISTGAMLSAGEELWKKHGLAIKRRIIY